MSATVTCAGKDVLRGHISLPLYGVWWADLLLDVATAPTGRVTLESVGGLSIKGTVIKPVGVDLEVAQVRVVGGAAGLWKPVKGAFKQATLRDPLNAILRTTSEELSSSVSSSLTSLQLAFWTLGKYQAQRAVGDLARLASERLGDPVNWRFLSDGKLWLGIEAWSPATLPKADLVCEQFPSERRTLLGVQTLSLLPGVQLGEVGRVRAVEHWITPQRLSTWAFI